MKRLFPLLVACIVGLCSCQQKTTVSIQFNNGEGKEAVILRPVNNHLFGYTDTISDIRNDSVYQLPVDITKTSLLRIVTDGNLIDLIVEPGNQYSVTFDFSNKNTPYKITGPNAPGNLLYNQLSDNKNMYKYEWIDDFTKAPLDTIPEKVDAYFRDAEQKEVARFDSLFKRKEINSKFFDFVKKDIHLYYSATLSRIARNASKSVNKDAYLAYWTKLYESTPLNENETGSRYFQNYAELYVRDYLTYRDEVAGKFKRPKFTSEKDYFEFIYNLYNQNIKDPKILEKVLAHQLYWMAINNKTSSKEIITYFDKFNQQFPNNPYSSSFIPFVNSLNYYHDKISKDFSAEVRFVENYEGINTFKEVLERVKGKPVFIDFWFSTCGPCREEFQYIKPLKEFLQKNGIEALFISVDNEARDQNWKDCIKFFELDGLNLRTSKALHSDLDTNYGIYIYPTYMLVGKDGNILLPRTKKPSEKEALYNQITEALK